ncbi:putative quinol monooxygenase [Marinomonas mediterranea]|uniref:putative quinol monooxygenase n=1 Tax=Marinomonas mediterranea TaxID=119864 RepID=UPI002349898C|nr:antibiotic biosynthesis monooxygenase [Marinomonas mediterranea]WCN08137.1 antibiotic biosynthesis monooxygenase [Marinomonas mediterranea]WCN12206.1 antibiotic biosynthesis monooxygenase [Marinomonas mediterranea]
MKIVLSGYIVIPEAELALVEDALVEHIALTKAEEGCLVFNVSKDPVNPCRYDVYEEFSSQAAFDFHQARVKSSPWGQATINVERHYLIKESTQ